jgi:predicted nucleic acid-binding protein
MTACLDSWAVLRWLEGADPAASRVEALLPSRPLMSWINLGEVWYVLARHVGSEAADSTVGQLRHRLTLDDATPERVLQAAAIKAANRLAYADAFALATALAHEVPLVTGDPEILAAAGPWAVEDAR